MHESCASESTLEKVFMKSQRPSGFTTASHFTTASQPNGFTTDSQLREYFWEIVPEKLVLCDSWNPYTRRLHCQWLVVGHLIYMYI